MFDLEEKSGIKEPTKAELKAYQRNQRNKAHKSVMRFIGENMASYGCILIILLMIGFIWTDMRIAIFNERTVIDGIVTVTMFLVAQYLMTQNGIECGKEYDVYINLHKEYIEKRDEIYRRGASLMLMFCDWQIDQEYEYYVRAKCKALKLDYDEYVEKYSKLNLVELKKITNAERAVKIYSLNQAKPIELTPDILLTDGMSKVQQGGVGQSAEEYIKTRTVGKKHVGLAIVTGFICMLPAFFLHEGATLELIIYTVFKLIMLLLRMYSGFCNGTRAYNTVEVKHISDKLKYLNLYLEFLDKKIYQTLGDKYGKIDFEEADVEAREEDEKSEDGEQKATL